MDSIEDRILGEHTPKGCWMAIPGTMCLGVNDVVVDVRNVRDNVNSSLTRWSKKYRIYITYIRDRTMLQLVPERSRCIIGRIWGKDSIR